MPTDRKLGPVYHRNFLGHKKNLRKFHKDFKSKTLFEFGAGWDLCSNIAMYCFGIEHQIVVDLHPLARAELINHVIAYYHTHDVEGVVRKPPAMIGDDLEGDLRRHFGIEYRAPQDATVMDLRDGSIDFVVSTNTLEHIPENAITRIMRECHRLCHEDSVVSMKVDYSDHYAHADPSISYYNFLKYSEHDWRKYNPPMHYQNRMRHPDYRDIFKAGGFDVVVEQSSMVDRHMVERVDVYEENAIAAVRGMPLAYQFAAYSPEELAVCAGRFIVSEIGAPWPAGLDGGRPRASAPAVYPARLQ